MFLVKNCSCCRKFERLVCTNFNCQVGANQRNIFPLLRSIPIGPVNVVLILTASHFDMEDTSGETYLLFRLVELQSYSKMT